MLLRLLFGRSGKECPIFMTSAPPDSSAPAREFEVGIYSFAELTPDPITGEVISPAQRIHNLLETIELADQVGLDVFGLGEHHRPDFVSQNQGLKISETVTNW